MRQTTVEESVLRVKEAADRVRARLDAAGRYSREQRGVVSPAADHAESQVFFGTSRDVGAVDFD